MKLHQPIHTGHAVRPGTSDLHLHLLGLVKIG